MKLWVDDIRTEPSGWVRAKTITEAIRLLATQAIEEVSLDHDISFKVSIGVGDARPFASPETFEPVAWFLAAAYAHREPLFPVTLHTANPVGAERMKAILEGFSVTIAARPPCNRFETPADAV